MSAVAFTLPRRQAVTLAMRALHRLDGAMSFRRHPLRNAAPILTLTFDDVPDTAVSFGAPILEDHGVRGTFFVAPSLLGRHGRDWDYAEAADLAAIAARGHEIGLHSHGHAPVAHLGPRAFRDDLARGLADLRQILPASPLDNYAFPFGFANPLHRARLGRSMRSCRTTHPGLNVGSADPLRLLSHPIGEGRRADRDIDRLLEDTAASGGWLIMTLHDVSEAPSPYGCTPATLTRLCRGAAQRGIAVCTMAEALDRCAMPARGKAR